MSRRLLALDPGLDKLGVAVFAGASLVKCDTLNGTKHDDVLVRVQCVAGTAVAWILEQGGCNELVVEWPQIYERGKSKGNPNLLMPLAGVCAAVAASLGVPSHSYLPRAWKGQVPKPRRKKDPYIIEARVRERLTPSEQQVYGAHPGWDCTDAVGLGLKRLGRFERRRVLPGAT